MTRRVLVAALGAACAVVLRTAPASASLVVCNRTGDEAYAAVAWSDGCSDLFGCENYVVQGWWAVDPGACATPIAGDLNSPYTDYEYYARSSARTWGGSADEGSGVADLRHCIASGAFKFGQSDDDADTCPGNYVYFKWIGLPEGQTDYTINLT